MSNLTGRDLLSIAQLNPREIRTVLDLAKALKNREKQFSL